MRGPEIPGHWPLLQSMRGPEIPGHCHCFRACGDRKFQDTAIGLEGTAIASGYAGTGDSSTLLLSHWRAYSAQVTVRMPHSTSRPGTLLPRGRISPRRVHDQSTPSPRSVHAESTISPHFSTISPRRVHDQSTPSPRGVHGSVTHLVYS